MTGKIIGRKMLNTKQTTVCKTISVLLLPVFHWVSELFRNSAFTFFCFQTVKHAHILVTLPKSDKQLAREVTGFTEMKMQLSVLTFHSSALMQQCFVPDRLELCITIQEDSFQFVDHFPPQNECQSGLNQTPPEPLDPKHSLNSFLQEHPAGTKCFVTAPPYCSALKVACSKGQETLRVLGLFMFLNEQISFSLFFQLDCANLLRPDSHYEHKAAQLGGKNPKQMRFYSHLNILLVTLARCLLTQECILIDLSPYLRKFVVSDCIQRFRVCIIAILTKGASLNVKWDKLQQWGQMPVLEG